MAQYPQQAIPNGFQILGQALTQGGQQFGDYLDNRSKLKLQMEEMAAAKAQAVLAKIRSDREEREAKAKAEREATEFTTKQNQQRISQSTRNEIAAGKAIPGKSVGGVIQPDEVVPYSPEEANRMLLKSGDLSGKDFVNMGSGGSTPSNVAEWNYYNSLPPEDQERFLEMKRAQKTIDLGGSYGMVGLGGQITKTVPKTLAPNELPSTKGAQAAAAAAGTESVTGAAGIAKDKAKREKEEAARKHQAYKMGKEAEIEGVNQFVSLVQSVKNNKNLYGATGSGKFLKSVWGSDFADVHADLDRIVSSGVVETLAKLKRESPTGSTGFGALSEKEMGVIQSSFTTLADRNISAKKAREELDRIASVMGNYLARVKKYENENPTTKSADDYLKDAGL